MTKPATAEIHPLPDLDPAEQLNRLHAQLVEAQAANVALESTIEAQRAHLAKLESNPFALVLNNLDAGSVLEELGEEIQKVTALVDRRQEPGVLAVLLTAKPYKPGCIDFVVEIKTKEPKAEKPHTLFFVGSDGALSRQDPRQKELPFGQ